MLIDRVVAEVEPQCRSLAAGESMPGSTEVLESLIGNGKRQFRFKCPKRWYDLIPTDDKNVRYCNECKQNVFLNHTEGEMKSHARNGHCVALAKEYEQLEFMGLIDFDGDQSDTQT